jgi:hypothetical protein
MEAIALASAAGAGSVLILAITTIVIIRLAITGTAPTERAPILSSIAQIILALRGKK